MSDIAHFFTPVGEPIYQKDNYKQEQFGSLFQVYNESGDFPSLTNIDIALIGVKESRNAEGNAGSAAAPDAVRPFLYKLFCGAFKPRVADLGDITEGHSTEDTY